MKEKIELLKISEDVTIDGSNLKVGERILYKFYEEYMQVIIELDEMKIESIPDKEDEVQITMNDHNYFGSVKVEELKLALRKMTAK